MRTPKPSEYAEPAMFHQHMFLFFSPDPCQAWTTVRAQINIDERNQSCALLLDYLRCSITISQNGQLPVLSAPPPTAPLVPPLLLDGHHCIIEQDFPALNTNLVALQQTQIAGQLGLLVNETRASRVAEAERKTAEKNKTSEQYFGPAGIIRL